jgi:hypothetical protein
MIQLSLGLFHGNLILITRSIPIVLGQQSSHHSVVIVFVVVAVVVVVIIIVIIVHIILVIVVKAQAVISMRDFEYISPNVLCNL